MALSVGIVGREKLTAVARDLRRGQGRLRRELTQGIKAAAEETLRDVRQAWETMPIRGQRVPGAKRPFVKKMPGTRIRHRIARVTEAEVTTSTSGPRARFVVRSDRLGNARNVPYHLDNGRLRHPIMGDRHHWANQYGQPTFYKTIRDDRPKFEKQADAALDRTAEAIEKGSP